MIWNNERKLDQQSSETRTDFGVFQQPVAFVTCGFESGVVWGETVKPCLFRSAKPLGAVLERRIQVNLSASP
jgi:hypothetical protein